MKRLSILIIVPIISYSTGFKTLATHIKSTQTLKSASFGIKAAESLALSKEALNSPKLDIVLNGRWLDEQPSLSVYTPYGSSTAPMATTRSFLGSVKLSYPIFTGFAIESQISKAHLSAIIASLKYKDIHRSLLLNLIRLYLSVQSLQSQLSAQKSALKALQDAYKKAQEFYNNGLLASAQLYNIEAKMYDMKAQITQSQGAIAQRLNQISYISGITVSSISGAIPLPHPPKTKKLIKLSHRYRADIKVLKKELQIRESEIKLAKSNLYPKLAIEAKIERFGDTLKLNGDGYTNANRNSVGVGVEWNIFAGGKDKHLIESAKYAKLAAASKLISYTQKVDSEIVDSYIELSTLKAKLISAKKRLQSQQSYYKQSVSRFNNRLISSDELSRAIASLAEAKALHDTIKASIKAQEANIWLMGGVELFMSKLNSK